MVMYSDLKVIRRGIWAYVRLTWKYLMIVQIILIKKINTIYLQSLLTYSSKFHDYKRYFLLTNLLRE